MCVSKLLRSILEFTREDVIMSAEVVAGDWLELRVHVRSKVRRRGRSWALRRAGVLVRQR